MQHAAPKDALKVFAPLKDNIPTKDFDPLKNFDALPDSAHVRLPVVCALRAKSSASIWRDVKAGRLPAPKKLGPRITAWNVGELRRTLSDAAA